MSTIIICDCCGGVPVSVNQVWVTGPSVPEAGGKIAHVCPTCIVEARLGDLLFEERCQCGAPSPDGELCHTCVEGDCGDDSTDETEER